MESGERELYILDPKCNRVHHAQLLWNRQYTYGLPRGRRDQKMVIERDSGEVAVDRSWLAKLS